MADCATPKDENPHLQGRWGSPKWQCPYHDEEGMALVADSLLKGLYKYDGSWEILLWIGVPSVLQANALVMFSDVKLLHKNCQYEVDFWKCRLQQTLSR
jgi:hypothetical protein